MQCFIESSEMHHFVNNFTDFSCSNDFFLYATIFYLDLRLAILIFTPGMENHEILNKFFSSKESQYLVEFSLQIFLRKHTFQGFKREQLYSECFDLSFEMDAKSAFLKVPRCSKNDQRLVVTSKKIRLALIQWDFIKSCPLDEKLIVSHQLDFHLQLSVSDQSYQYHRKGEGHKCMGLFELHSCTQYHNPFT